MIQSKLQRFLVLGSGSWGTALAIYLARLKHHVMLWGHREADVKELIRANENTRFLPGFTFPKDLTLSHDIAAAFKQVGSDATILIAVPSRAFEETILLIRSYLTQNMTVLWATKGLAENGDLLHEICLKHLTHHPLAVISGPSFAQEVARGLPTAITIACNTQDVGERLVNAFHSDVFRVYLSQDVVGVELGGAVKNVLAIATGMSDGLGFGANARAALITRGLKELCRLGEKMGAKLPTLMGLSGLGDMVLTCTDNQSRNRRFGLALGQGQDIKEAERQINQVVEGKKNAKQVMMLAKKCQVDMPICEQVYAVLYDNVPPKQAVTNLLTRSPKTED